MTGKTTDNQFEPLKCCTLIPWGKVFYSYNIGQSIISADPTLVAFLKSKAKPSSIAEDLPRPKSTKKRSKSTKQAKSKAVDGKCLRITVGGF